MLIGTIFLYLAILVIVHVNGGEVKLYPEKFRCVSQVQAPAGFFNVDEYVDRNKLLSSTRANEPKFGYSSTYYNEIQEIDGKFDRRFVLVKHYADCETYSFKYYPLRELRDIQSKMLPKDKHSISRLEVAIGPSTILLAIEQTLDRFSYVKTEFTAKFMVETDTYKYLVNNYGTSNKWLIEVQVPSLPRKVSRQTKTLADHISQATNPDLKLDILGIEISKVITADSDTITSRTLLFKIQYLIMAEMGKDELGVESGQNGAEDFEKTPFLLPLGFGCFQDTALIGQKYLAAPDIQFSAQYRASNGSLGLSYVAYDGKRNILRLDRDGRKSIYDLNKGLSYHVYNSNRQATGILPSFAKCISSEIDPSYIQAPFALERLLGFSTLESSKPARHLGSRLIDQVPYEVYETELHFNGKQLEAYNIPILIESFKSAAPKKNVNLIYRNRFMATYYVQEFKSSDNSNEKPIQIIKFMELRRLLQSSKRGTFLLNRLEFVEFSWSLDVLPDEDPETDEIDKIFNLESCHENQSKQVALSFEVSPTAIIEKNEIKDSSNIKETLKEIIANRLEISPLNIASIDMTKLSTTKHHRCESRIVELFETTIENYFLGYLEYSATIKDLESAIINRIPNRHSLVDCKLDSLITSEPNYMMFCYGLTTCLQLKQLEFEKFIKSKLRQKANEELLWSFNEAESICEFHKVSILPDTSIEDESLMTQVIDKIYRLTGVTVPMRIERQLQQGNTEQLFYQGRISQPEARFISQQESSDWQSPLLNLRYTTKSEESTARNMNYAVKMVRKEMRMQECLTACQLDDFCESFSLCLRQKVAIQGNDCIISTLRQTSEQMDKILEAAKEAKDSFDLKVTSSLASQVFRFKHDSECSLHPKLASTMFQVVDVIRNITAPEKLNEEDKQAAQNLEECATSAHDTSLKRSTDMSSTFTYCPLSSRCFLYDQTLSGLSQPQNCYVYAKSHLQFYDSTPFSRVAISLEAFPSSNDGKQLLGDSGLGNWLEGLSVDQCARDCTLRQSGCLSFDFCKLNHETSVCILYKIRSPMQITGNEKLLPQELDVYSRSKNQDETGARILEDDQCSHFSFKSSFFNVRLSLMFEESKNLESTKVAEIEDLIMAQDRKLSDDLNTKIEPLKPSITSADTNSGIKFVFLFLGLVLGCIGITYGAMIRENSKKLVEYIKTKREGSSTSHFDEIVLPTHMDL